MAFSITFTGSCPFSRISASLRSCSFAAASAKLYKTPSALSYTIHRLESDLNIQLLDRSGHRARFTPTGQMLLEKGREVLHIARELEIRAVKLQQGGKIAFVWRWTAPFPWRCSRRQSRHFINNSR